VLQVKIDLSDTEKIIQQYRKEKGILIPLLQDIQAVYGYVPAESIELISRELSIYPVKIYGILTFYTQFYLTPRGRHTIKVCQGTACHVRGGKRIMEEIERELNITHGETTEDGLFSLARVACMGCCALAPVIVENDKVYGTCTPAKVREVINKSKAEG